jgi:hypothetical protein
MSQITKLTMEAVVDKYYNITQIIELTSICFHIRGNKINSTSVSYCCWCVKM